jgi:hypothetical protein
MRQIVVRQPVVLDRVVDDSAQKSDIASDTKLAVEVSDRSGARKPRIDHDHFRVAIAFGFDCPFKTTGMVFRRIPAHDQHHVGVFYVHPTIRHRPASERWSQT